MSLFRLPDLRPRYAYIVRVDTESMRCGEIHEYYEPLEDSRMLLCDGRLVDSEVEPKLFSILGFRFGGNEPSPPL